MPMERPAARSFRDLLVWQKAHGWVLTVCSVVILPPFELPARDFCLLTPDSCLVHLKKGRNIFMSRPPKMQILRITTSAGSSARPVAGWH